MEFERSIVEKLNEFLKKPLPVFQVLIGPRQVGKTTAAQQLIEKFKTSSIYATADQILPPGPEWIEAQWNLAQLKFIETKKPVLLVLDEVQKVDKWSEVIKRLWDEEKTKGNIRLLVLGSSALLLQKGLSESLSGRFFLHKMSHWSYGECREAFGWNLNQWIYFGGYPGAAIFIEEESDWKKYVSESLIETVIGKDVLQMQPITKPMLMRHLFGLAATYPAQILSYNKMLGQLQDAGNATTLAHYLKILEGAFLVSGLELFSQGQIKKRGSSPKFVLWNNALVNALSLKSFKQALTTQNWWGRLMENAVGAHLLNNLSASEWSICYWREDSVEVDFVIAHGEKIVAIEVKCGSNFRQSGLALFTKKYPKAKILIIGEAGMSFETFFRTSPNEILENI